MSPGTSSGGLHLLLTAVADDRRVRREVVLERLDRRFRLALLDERERGVQHDDGGDRRGQDGDPGDHREQRRSGQQERERMRELLKRAGAASGGRRGARARCGRSGRAAGRPRAARGHGGRSPGPAAAGPACSVGSTARLSMAAGAVMSVPGTRWRREAGIGAAAHGGRSFHSSGTISGTTASASAAAHWPPVRPTVPKLLAERAARAARAARSRPTAPRRRTGAGSSRRARTGPRRAR